MKEFTATIINRHGYIIEKKVNAESVLEASQKLKKSDPGCKIKVLTLVKKHAGNVIIYMNGDQIEMDPANLYRHGKPPKDEKPVEPEKPPKPETPSQK